MSQTYKVIFEKVYECELKRAKAISIDISSSQWLAIFN